MYKLWKLRVKILRIGFIADIYPVGSYLFSLFLRVKASNAC